MLDSGVYRALVTASDYLLLNVMWLVACVPVVSAPAATAALFEVIRSRHRGEDADGVFRSYVTAFRQVWARATAVGALWCGAGVLLGADLLISQRMGGTAGTALFLVFCSASLVFALASTALYPTLASFEARWHTIARNAVLIGLLFPLRGIAAVVVVVVASAIVVTLPITLLVAGSVTAAAVYHLYRSAFTKLAARQAKNAPTTEGA